MVEARQLEIKAKQTEISQNQEKIQRLELRLKEQKSLTEKALKDYETLNQRTLKLQQDVEEQINNNTQLLADNSQRQVELKLKEEEIARLEAKESKATRMKEQLNKKVKQLELSMKEVESSKETLKGIASHPLFPPFHLIDCFPICIHIPLCIYQYSRNTKVGKTN